MMEKAIMNDLTRRQKICTYSVICFLSLFGGVEYAVILPTVYLHLRDTYDAPAFYLGLVISAYSLSGLFAAPIMGRFYDKTRRSKILISLTNVFEFCGSLMYWIGLSPLFLVASRLVAGLGNGYFPIVLAEISHGTSNEARTSVVSAVMGVRQIGLLVGPGFNLFLSKLNFYIGPFIVDKYSSPGIFLAFLWLISQLLVTFLYFPLTRLVKLPDDQLTNNSTAINSESNTIQNTDTTVTVSQTTQHTDSPEQVLDTTQRVENPPPAQITQHASNNNESMPSNKPVDDTSTSVQGEVHALQHRTMKQVILAIAYDKYMAIFMLSFVSVFNQTGVETIVSPICSSFLGWTELEISLMFCIAGVLILVAFFLVHVFSKRYDDRSLIMVGLLCQIVPFIWFLYWVPTFIPNNPADYQMNTIILLPAIAVNVFGLPFLFVCHISLFSKLLDKNIQGIGHGIRRIIGGLAAILGPLWASSLLGQYHILYGVMLGLNLIAFLLLVLSYKQLIAPVTSKLEDVPDVESSTDEEANERTPLVNG